MPAALMDPVTPESGHESHLPQVHSHESGYDGSRTPADKQLLIWQLFEGIDGQPRAVGEIAQILGMNPRTVKAVIARKDQLITDARMLLKANALEFAHNAIEASKEAAARGKLEGISAMLDRLGVTEPPKSQQATQVAVQVNLHGGPEPVSLAKVQVESEDAQIQAQSEASLITEPMITAEVLTNERLREPSIPQSQATHASKPVAATFVAESEKQA